MDEASEPKGDSRDHSRQPIELKVEYKRLNSFFSDYTRNISKGGTFIRTGKPLDVGTEFVFKLYVPNLDEPLRIHGRVQWVVTQEDLEAGQDRGHGEPGMGIRFVYHDSEERAAIENRVEAIMVDSLGQRLYSKLMAYSHSRSESTEYSSLFAGDTFSDSTLTDAGAGDETRIRRRRDD